MSVKQSLVLVCLGFLTGASLASAELDELGTRERWSCGDHFWGLTITIVDEDKRLSEIDFNGDGFKLRQNVAPATMEASRGEYQLVFQIKDEFGGSVKCKLIEDSSDANDYDCIAKESKEARYVSIGTCSKD